MELVVALPSRGLIHSRTIEAVIRAIEYRGIQDYTLVLTHDLPIPDSHETVCEQALATGAEFIWIVEEDVVPPVDALELMFEYMSRMQADGAFIDYPLGGPETWNCAAVWDGYVVFCGTGCLLLKRSVFETIPRPWFERGKEVSLSVENGELNVQTFKSYYPYGGQDIHFMLKMRNHGLRVAYVPMDVAICQHLELLSWGRPGDNAGTHKVASRPFPTRQLGGK